MKKIHLIESVISFLASDNAGDLKGKYHPEEIKVWMSSAFNSIIYNAWINGKKYSEFSQLDAWSKTYEIAVLSQVGTKAHALLPFAPVQLSENAGIRQIADANNSLNVFAPMEATAEVIFAELEVNDADSTPTYSLEQNNLNTGAGESSHLLRLEKLPTTTPISTIDVMMIVPFDQTDDFDDVAIPSGMEENIISQVIELMSKKPMPDTTNDEVIRPQNQ